MLFLRIFFFGFILLKLTVVKRFLLTTFFLFLTSLAIYATNYYSDPVNGSMSNSGTSASPWGSLSAVMASNNVFTAGDIIFLRTGNHGFPQVNKVNTGYVEIRAQFGHVPVIERLYVGNNPAAAYWKFNGLTIQIENIAAFPISLITLYPSTSNIVIENCTIQSIDNTSAYTRNDWRDKTNHGIQVKGSDHVIIGNTIKNVAVGLSIEAENTLISNNEIQYFTIDGIRGLASDCIYDGNSVKDNIAVFIYAENHYDGFQTYTCCPVGTDTLKNVILRNNLIINCTDTTRNWRGPMQGMVGFDGYFENWTIENNIIITDHWHGITLLGAINCKIINNTVVDPYDVTPIDPFDPQSTSNSGPAWIKIAAHKNGDLSFNNTIRNNLTAGMQNDVNIGIVDFNTIIGASSNYINHFVNYSVFDYHLLSTSNAIDAGTSILAPSTDYEGNARPNGVDYDAGAYEYQLPTNILHVSLNDKILLYPNPSTGSVVIKTSTTINSIKIKNELGQELLNKAFSDTKMEYLDLSNYDSGVYFFFIETAKEGVLIKKLIIN